jgi:hypothetical protein
MRLVNGGRVGGYCKMRGIEVIFVPCFFRISSRREYHVFFNHSHVIVRHVSARRLNGILFTTVKSSSDGPDEIPSLSSSFLSSSRSQTTPSPNPGGPDSNPPAVTASLGSGGLRHRPALTHLIHLHPPPPPPSSGGVPAAFAPPLYLPRFRHHRRPASRSFL